MGCSQSTTDAIAIRSIEPEPRPKSASPHPKSASLRPKSTSPRPLPNQQSDRIVEDCMVIWLLNDSSLEVELEKAKLCHVVSTVKIFTNRDECVTYITNVRVE